MRDWSDEVRHLSVQADELSTACRDPSLGGPDSDVGLLFALAPDARLGFAMFDLEVELAEIFGRPVDLLSKDSVHRLLRDEVLAEAKVLYAA